MEFTNQQNSGVHPWIKGKVSRSEHRLKMVSFRWDMGICCRQWLERSTDLGLQCHIKWAVDPNLRSVAKRATKCGSQADWATAWLGVQPSPKAWLNNPTTAWKIRQCSNISVIMSPCAVVKWTCPDQRLLTIETGKAKSHQWLYDHIIRDVSITTTINWSNMYRKLLHFYKFERTSNMMSSKLSLVIIESTVNSTVSTAIFSPSSPVLMLSWICNSNLKICYYLWPLESPD